MAFHDTRLPEEVERGAQGGPRFKTTITPLVGGAEKRNIDWEQSRGAWDLSYGLLHEDLTQGDSVSFNQIRDFFYARNGAAHSFRFKDWTDYNLPRQIIGVTDTSLAVFQIFKRYTDGGIDFDRTIDKIVATTHSVWVNNVSITEGAGASQYQIDELTGIITIGSTLAAQDGTNVEVETEFDVAVRFQDDGLDLAALLADKASIPQIPIVEVKGES